MLFLCDHQIEHYVKQNSVCEINILEQTNNYKTCQYEIFQIDNFEIPSLNHNIQIILSSKNNKLFQRCGAQEDVLVIQGTYLLTNLNNCIYTINNHVIRNAKTTISTSFKFLDILEEHKFIPNITLNSINMLNISESIAYQKKLLNSIKFNHKVHHYTNSTICIIILIITSIVIIIIVCKRNAIKSKLCQNTKNENISLQKLPTTI